MKDKLFYDNPHCFYCGVRTMHPSQCRPDDRRMATLEHVDSAYSGNKKPEGRPRVVLACFGCNSDKGWADQKKFMGKKKAKKLVKCGKRIGGAWVIP